MPKYRSLQKTQIVSINPTFDISILYSVFSVCITNASVTFIIYTNRLDSRDITSHRIHTPTPEQKKKKTQAEKIQDGDIQLVCFTKVQNFNFDFEFVHLIHDLWIFICHYSKKQSQFENSVRANNCVEILCDR